MKQDFEYRAASAAGWRNCSHSFRSFRSFWPRETGELRKGGGPSRQTGKTIRNAKHFHEPITLEDVCEAAGFSVSYFQRSLQKETGEGFAKYLTRVRMDEAKRSLRETNLPVAEVCERVGYSDRKHFTHTFHKTAGLNPAEYRKLYG